MTFETQIVPDLPEAHATPFLILVVPQASLPASLAALDQAAGGAIARCYAAGDFSGKKDETVLVYPEGPRPRVLLVGIGLPDDTVRSAVRRGAAVGAKRARATGVPKASLFVAPEARGSLSPRDVGQIVAEGAAQGAWQFLEMKLPPEDKKPPLERVDILAPTDTEAVREGHQVGAAIAAGHLVCRGLQVLPGNLCPPRRIAEAATEVATRLKFDATVLDRAGIEKEGMGALLAVAQGSAEEPRFIILSTRAPRHHPSF